jgi:hypothetical protein
MRGGKKGKEKIEKTKEKCDINDTIKIETTFSKQDKSQKQNKK